jgi:hypothetical protein
MKRSELAYLQDTDNSDEMTEEQLRRKYPFSNRDREIKGAGVEGFKEGMTQAVDLATDVMPFVGSAKAAAELPEDVALVEELIAAGYEEGDIKKMGLGGTMAVLTGLGFLPGAKLAADVGKRAIKEGVEEAAEELGTQTRRAFGQEALISPQRQAQLDAAAQLPASERRKFLKEANRPEQFVFHGAKSMSEPESVDHLVSKLGSKISDQLDDTFPYIGDMSSDPNNVRLMKPDEYLDFMKFRGLKYVAMRPDGEFDTVDIRARKNKDTGEIEIVHLDPETMEEGKVVLMTIPKEHVESIARETKSGQALQVELQDVVRKLSRRNSDLLSDYSTRKDRVVATGFDPYEGSEEAIRRGSKFEGEYGMAGKATGSHMELTHDLLSTSRAPGVSMKPSFGGRDTRNIVYAPLRPEQVRDMTPEEYDRIRAFGGEDLPPLEEGQIGYSLPKSSHVEDEIAVRMPEELEVKDLETTGAERMVTRAVVEDAPSEEFVGPLRAVGEDKSLRDLVAEEQIMRDDLVERFNSFGKGTGLSGATASDGSNIAVRDIEPGKKAEDYILHRMGPRGRVEKVGDLRQMAYNNVRKYLNDMLGISRFSRGQGTTDAYDEMLDEFFDTYPNNFVGLGKTVRTLSESLPDGQRKKMMQALDKLGRIGKSVDSMSATAKDYNKEALRGVSDDILLDILFDRKRSKLPNAETRRKRIEIETLLDEAADGDLAAADSIGRPDLKRMLMLMTQNMRKGGLMTPR